MTAESSTDGGWPGGWVLSALAGVIAAILARWLGDTGIVPAVLVGLAVFVIFGVLLGMFWTASAAAGSRDDPEEGLHQHDDRGHDQRVPVGARSSVLASTSSAPRPMTPQPLAPQPVAPKPMASPPQALQPVPLPMTQPIPAADTVAAEAPRPASPAPVSFVSSMPVAGLTAAPGPNGEPVPDVAPMHVGAPAAEEVARSASTSDINSVTEAVSKAGAKPVGLAGPRGGLGDALQTLEGIGPALEKLCHGMGIYHFDQIASWGEAETAWMDSNLKGFKGRVTRDKWVRQAKLIAEVGLDEFARRARTNDY